MLGSYFYSQQTIVSFRRLLDEDGDELDALIITKRTATAGVLWKQSYRVLGVDDNEVDDRLSLRQPTTNTGNAINSLEFTSTIVETNYEHHFNHYKDLKKPG